MSKFSEYQKCGGAVIRLPDGSTKVVSLAEAMQYAKDMEKAETEIYKALENE